MGVKNCLILFIKEKVETHHQNNKKMIFKEVKHPQFVLKSIIDKEMEKNQ